MATATNWNGTIYSCPASQAETGVINTVSLGTAEIGAEVLTCTSCVACKARAGAIRVAFTILAALHRAFRRSVALSASERFPKIDTLHRLRCNCGCITCHSRHCNATVQSLKPNIAMTSAVVALTVARAIIDAALILTFVPVVLLAAQTGSH
jgi:hypothetical protein